MFAIDLTGSKIHLACLPQLRREQAFRLHISRSQSAMRLTVTPQPGSIERGTCGYCRHANHGTDDADEGFWACPWLGATADDAPCRILYRVGSRYVFEPFDGANGTWGTGDPTYRAVPRGFEAFEIVAAPDCLPAADESLLDFNDVLNIDLSPRRRSWLQRLRFFFRG